jgi:hypothetical protein
MRYIIPLIESNADIIVIIMEAVEFITSMEVGPSALPMIPTEAASLKSKSNLNGRNRSSRYLKATFNTVTRIHRIVKIITTILFTFILVLHKITLLYLKPL